MTKLLEGKNALVTGASRGIGEAIAIEFAKHGANVAFTYLSSEEKAKALEANLSQHGVKAIAYKSDAASFSQAEELVASVLKDFGTLHIVVTTPASRKTI